MTFTRDLSGNNPTDIPYKSYNRTNAGEPNGTVTPQFAGEIVLDTTSNALWEAVNLNNNGWVMLTPI